MSVAANGAQSNGTSYSASVSPDGTKVAFRSTATNLDPSSPPPNNPSNVYLRDRANNVTVRNRVLDQFPYSGDVYNYVSFGPVMSPDNSTVMFGYNYGVDADHGTIILWSPSGLGYDERIRVGDGYERQLTAGDFNGDGTKIGYNIDRTNVHRRDIPAGSDQAVTPAVQTATNVSLSGSARYLVFDAYEALVPRDDNGISDIYVYDFTMSQYTLVS